MDLVLASEQAPDENEKKHIGKLSEPTRAKLKNSESEAIEDLFSLAGSSFASLS